MRVECEEDATLPGLRLTAEVRVQGPTGVEMEALTAVSVACLTVYDMVKAVDRGMRIEGSAFSPRMAAVRAPIGRTRREIEVMSGLISVAEALSRILASVTRPVAAEPVPLARAAGGS